MIGVKESRVPAGVDVGGHLVLNFVNTCGGAGKERDAERLVAWCDAIDWATASSRARSVLCDRWRRSAFGGSSAAAGRLYRRGNEPFDVVR